MSEKTKVIMNNSLLSLIAGLLTIIMWFGYRSVDKIDCAVETFNAMNIQNEAAHNELIRQIGEIKVWTKYVYDNEIHQNTERSTQNEKDLVKVKSKVGIF